jgi:hypothetical protein
VTASLQAYGGSLGAPAGPDLCEEVSKLAALKKGDKITVHGTVDIEPPSSGNEIVRRKRSLSRRTRCLGIANPATAPATYWCGVCERREELGMRRISDERLRALITSTPPGEQLDILLELVDARQALRVVAEARRRRASRGGTGAARGKLGLLLGPLLMWLAELSPWLHSGQLPV